MTSPPIKDAPAFDFYAERWSHGTRHLSKVERSDYLDLLVFQWTELAIPSDLDAVARILGYRRAAQIPAAVLEKFPVCADGKRRNARMEVLRAEQRERIRKKSEQRRTAAGARWERQRSGKDAGAMPPPCGADAVALPPLCGKDAAALRAQCPPPTTHHPPQIPAESPPVVPQGDAPPTGAVPSGGSESGGNPEPGGKNAAYDTGFEEFWEAYPHKVGKGGAWRVWRRIRERPPNELLLAALERQKASSQWRRDHGRFIPHPATWLSQRRWEDAGRQEETSPSTHDRHF